MIIRLLTDEIQGNKVTTLDLINSALDAPVASGLSVADFRARNKVDKALDKLTPESTELYLSDADYETLKSAVEGLRFNNRQSIVKSFIEDLFPEVHELTIV